MSGKNIEEAAQRRLSGENPRAPRSRILVLATTLVGLLALNKVLSTSPNVSSEQGNLGDHITESQSDANGKNYADRRTLVTSRIESTTPRSRAFTAIIVVVFGVIFPLFLILQAYASMQQLNQTLRSADGFPLLQEFKTLKPALEREEDYMLASQIVAESASQRTMINKQLMKASAMHVGFATMSLGLMLSLLGFKERQQVAFSGGGIQLDLKRVTSGIVVFLAGSAITTVAAVLPNDYRVVKPFYFSREGSSGEAAAFQLPESDIGDCIATFSAQPDNLMKCLQQAEEAKKTSEKQKGK